MAYSDHLCEECDHWDNINGCWMDSLEDPALDPGQSIACPNYEGEEYDDEEDRDGGWDDDDQFWYQNGAGAQYAGPPKADNGEARDD